MDNQYISKLPLPACTVDTDGIISGANPLMKNVFLYEDIVGYNFFTMTGYKRDQLLKANEGEIILERNGKIFKLWVNEEAKEDEEIVHFVAVRHAAVVEVPPQGQQFADVLINISIIIMIYIQFT